MLTPEDILQIMDERVSSKMNVRTFLNKRPEAVDKKVEEFVVVALPYSASNRTIGDDDWWIDMTVTFEILSIFYFSCTVLTFYKFIFTF